MDISSARIFLAVVSTKSISRAAESLFLSQSTVSFHLKALEEELGVKLIERNRGHRQIEVTQKGLEFIYIAERFIQVWNEAHELQNKNTNSLTISIVDSLNIYTFSGFFERILFGDPPVKLKIFTHQTSEIFEHVENRTADVGFVLSQRKFQNVITKPIFREKLFLAKLMDQPPDKNAFVHAADLDFNSEIMFEWGPGFAQWHNTWCRYDTQPILQVDTIAMLMLFLKDQNWTVLPHSIIKSLQKEYPIYGIPIIEGPPDRICYKLIHRFPKPTNTVAIEIFNKELDQYLAENLYDLK